MNHTTLQLAYGRDYVKLEVPTANLLGVYQPPATGDVADENQLISESLAHPIGSPTLPELIHVGDKVAIITSDLTRPCPSHLLLSFILTELATAGIPDKDIFIIMALGIHRPMTEEEIIEAVSPEIYHRYEVLNHDVSDTVYIGATSAGTPVEFFRPLVEADARICLGNLDFHYFAGYSGGAKAIFPGCASQAGVAANHAMMLRPEAAAGRIEGNPLRTDIEEAAAMLGVDFILNVVVDENHTIVGAVAGDVTAAHRKGCEMVAARGKVKIPRLADIVVASAGGYPKDINFHQAHKALENIAPAAKKGGTIIFIAECPEGFANQTFEDWLLEAASTKELIDRLQKQFVLGGHKAAAIAALQEKASIYLVSNLPDDTIRRGGLIPYKDPQKAFDDAFQQHGQGSEVIVLPQAASLVPHL